MFAVELTKLIMVISCFFFCTCRGLSSRFRRRAIGNVEGGRVRCGCGEAIELLGGKLALSIDYDDVAISEREQQQSRW